MKLKWTVIILFVLPTAHAPYARADTKHKKINGYLACFDEIDKYIPGAAVTVNPLELDLEKLIEKPKISKLTIQLPPPVILPSVRNGKRGFYVLERSTRKPAGRAIPLPDGIPKDFFKRDVAQTKVSFIALPKKPIRTVSHSPPLPTAEGTTNFYYPTTTKYYGLKLPGKRSGKLYYVVISKTTSTKGYFGKKVKVMYNAEVLTKPVDPAPPGQSLLRKRGLRISTEKEKLNKKLYLLPHSRLIEKSVPDSKGEEAFHSDLQSRINRFNNFLSKQRKQHPTYPYNVSGEVKRLGQLEQAVKYCRSVGVRSKKTGELLDTLSRYTSKPGSGQKEKRRKPGTGRETKAARINPK